VTIRATVLIETIPAAFEMDESFYELRDHRRRTELRSLDYIFSFIRNSAAARVVLPTARGVTMGPPFPQVVCRPADPDLPPPRIHAMGGHGGADPDQGRRPLRTPRRSTKSCRTRYGRCRPVTMATGSHIRSRAGRQWSIRFAGRFPPTLGQTRRRPRDAARLLTVPRVRSPKAGLRTNVDIGINYRTPVRAARQPGPSQSDADVHVGGGDRLR